MEYWNGGILGYWESKADDGLILNSDPSHLYKNESRSTEPSIPAFQYSGPARSRIRLSLAENNRNPQIRV